MADIDLYDPKDPHIRDRVSREHLRQTLANQIHQIWCEWASSMVQQGFVESTQVPKLLKLFVPFHNLPPESQMDHIHRADKLISEFVSWKLTDKAMRKGGPVGGGKAL